MDKAGGRITSTERSRKFREKARDDPERLKAAQEKDRERKRKARAAFKKSCTEKELEDKRIKKKEEMRKYRQRKKERTAVSATASMKEEGGKIAAKTIKRRAQKKTSRENNSIEQLQKRKAVLNTQNWRLRLKFKDSGSNEGSSRCKRKSKEFSSYWSEHRAIKKAKVAMPETPIKKARIIEKLSKSPRTTRILENRGIMISPTNQNKLQLGKAVMKRIKLDIEQLKPKGGSQRDQLHAYKLMKSTIRSAPLSKKSHIRGCLSKYFKMKVGIPMARRTDWWSMPRRKKRKDCLEEATINQVKAYFLSADVSRPVPGKNEVVKMKDIEGALQTLEKHIMVISLDEAFKTFKERYPEVKIGITSFKKLKPGNVRKVSETSRRTCLCTTCCNLALKIQSLKQLITLRLPNQNSLSENLTKKVLQDAVLCKYEDYPKKACLERVCENCPKISMFLEELKDLYQEEMSWCHWEYIQLEKEGAIKRCISCIEKRTSLEDFISFLDNDLLKYPAHIFRATWQHSQMTKCISSLDTSSIDVVLLMDFSENYRCAFKDEVQSGYFDQQQVTIHPMMAYYRESNNLVKHALIGISPDLKHDAALAREFEKEAFQLIKQQTSLSNLSRVVEWTDGCAAQYKCKFAFADISKHEIDVHRNYFETSHGKSPCDGLGSVVKNSCYRAVITGKAILGDAKAVMKHCSETLAHASKQKQNGEISKWDIIYVDHISRPDQPEKLLTVKGTHKIHSVQSMSEPYRFHARNLSCYCDQCIQNTTSSCSNKEWVEPWTTHTVSSDSAGSSTRTQKPSSVKKQSKPVHGRSSNILIHPEASSTTDDPELGPLQEGDFVAVHLPVVMPRKNAPAHIFMAEVLEDDSGVMVNFMARSGRLYHWPDVQDVALQPREDIVCKINAPKLENERAQFSFTQQDFDKVKRHFGKRTVYFK